MDAAPLSSLSMQTTRTERGLTRLQLFMMSFGAIVGVGWITILGYWLEQAGPGGSVLALTIGAGAILIVVGNYGALARADLLAKGEIGAVASTLGAFPAFATTAALTLACVSIVAFEAVSAGWILVTLLPAIEGPVLYSLFGRDVHLGAAVIAIVGICAVARLNLRSVATAAGAQIAIVLLKIAVTAGFCVAGVYWGEARNLLPLLPGSPSVGATMAGILTIAATMPLWFSGFNVASLLAGERDSAVTPAAVARLMHLSVVAACAFYICVVLAASMVIPWPRLISAPLPATAGFREGLQNVTLVNAVLISGLLGIASAWIACFAAATRVLDILRSQLRRSFFVHARENTGSSPARSTTILVAVIAMLLALSGRAVLLPIVNVAASCFGLVYLLVCCVAHRRATRLRERIAAVAGAGVSVFMSLYVVGSAVHEHGWWAPEMLVMTLGVAVTIWSWRRRSKELER